MLYNLHTHRFTNNSEISELVMLLKEVVYAVGKVNSILPPLGMAVGGVNVIWYCILVAFTVADERVVVPVNVPAGHTVAIPSLYRFVTSVDVIARYE